MSDAEGRSRSGGLPSGPALLRAERGKDTRDPARVDLPAPAEGMDLRIG